MERKEQETDPLVSIYPTWFTTIFSFIPDGIQEKTSSYVAQFIKVLNISVCILSVIPIIILFEHSFAINPFSTFCWQFFSYLIFNLSCYYLEVCYLFQVIESNVNILYMLGWNGG